MQPLLNLILFEQYRHTDFTVFTFQSELCNSKSAGLIIN